MSPVDRDTFVARMKAGKVAKAGKSGKHRTVPRETVLEEAEGPVTFICNHFPSYGLAVPSGLVSFERGVLTLEDPRDIAHVRKHYWYGSRILEQERPESDSIGPEERPAGTAASAPEAASASTPPAASSPHSPFRRFLRQAEAGGWRCGLCDMASPYFPTEGAALNHLFHQHRNVTVAPQGAPGGNDGPE